MTGPRDVASIVAVVIAVLVLAGCASTDQGDPAEGSTPVSGAVELPVPPTSAPATTVPLPAMIAYEPIPEEPGSDAKAVAAKLIESVGNYSADDSTADALAASLVGLPDPDRVSQGVARLRTAGADASAQVLYPQLGGLRDSTASVMVVVRQTVRLDGAVSTMTHTVDVRLDRTPASWEVVDVMAAPLTVDGAELGTAPPDGVRRLLENARIELPDTARADLTSGGTDERVVALLEQIGAAHQLAVTVLATGHPAEVFGTDGLSNHTMGRAVDIWAIDGRSVFDQRDDALSPAHSVAEMALAAGATEVGGPWDLDGPGGASFANDLHQDHLHLAWDA